MMVHRKKAVIHEIDLFFAERFLKDKSVHTYSFKPIDTTDKQQLKKLTESKLPSYYESHPDNTLRLFVEVKIEKAKKEQQLFPKYKTVSEDKKYWHILQRWIDFLNEIETTSEHAKTETISFKNNMNEKYNGLFAMSQKKVNFKNQRTGETTSYRDNNIHPFELANLNTYDHDTKELLDHAEQIKCNSQFLINLGRLFVLDVHPFLDHNYERTSNKEKFFQYIKYAALNSEIVKAQGIKDAIKDWVEKKEKLRKVENDLFHFFDLYFQAHSGLMMTQKHHLYQFGGATMEYFISIRSEEEKVAEVAINFIKEIRNNVLNFESKEQIKKYLEQIQTKMNVVYDCLELDRKAPALESQAYHHSFPSIQNLIRDIAIKESIEIAGDKTGLTTMPKPTINIPDLSKLYAEVIPKDSISKVWWSQTKNEAGKIFDPFNLIVHGVYAPGYFYTWLYEAEEQKQFDPAINLGKEIEKYGKSFQKGFKEFKEKAVSPEQIKELAFGIIQKFISERPQPLSHTKDNAGTKFIQPLRWDDFGERIGRVYCSWQLVIENQSLFEPLFQKAYGLPTKDSEREQTRTERLNDILAKYGFFNLTLVQKLNESGKQKLTEILSEKGVPYSIAMFDFLGYLKYLEKEHFQTKYKLYRELAKWFDSDSEGRTIKGNISSLLKNSNENKERYTAHKHKETVQKDYQKLK